MKKILLWLFIIIFLFIGTVWGVFFTQTGNSYIASYIEDKVNSEQSDVKLKVNKLRLTFNTLDFDASIDDNSNINISGDLKLFEKIVDLKYDIKIKELSIFEKLIQRKLNGPFFTKGIFKGNRKSALIEGISDVAHSDTSYKIDLIDFDPININFFVKKARLEKLLYLLNEPIYATGRINAQGDIQNAKMGQLDGIIKASLSYGRLKNDIVNKAFRKNITSRIGFKSDIKARLLGNSAEIKADLITSFADVFANKMIIDLNTNKIISDYKINMKNLSKLQGVIGTKLNGKFTTQGDLSILDENIKISGKSDILNSFTNYDIKIEEDKIKNLKFLIKDAKVNELLKALNEPVYAKGIFNIDGDLKTEDDFLEGNIKTNILKTELINQVVNTVFKKNFKKKVAIKGEINTKVSDNKAISNVNIKTSLADFYTKNTKFSFKDTSLKSDYTLDIPSLRKLKGISIKKLRGKMKIQGNFSSNNGIFFLNGQSDFLNGKLDFVLKNDDLTASLKNAQIKKLTYMLYYPQIFDSQANFDLDYNLLLKKGQLNGILTKGHIVRNDFSNLVKQFTKVDLSKELYENTKIKTNIDDMILNSVVNMKSKNTSIDVLNSYINLNDNITDNDIKVKVRKREFALKVKGNISNPKISLDSKKLLRNEAKKQIEKHRNKIEKNINKKDGAKDLVNTIKSLF